MRTTVYISGPVSLNGKCTPDEIANNITVFDNTETKLERAGFRVFSPINNGLDEDASWQEHMRADISLLMMADEILMLPGWEQSRGATLELFIATQIGLTVTYA